jgi:hypothetical protein
MQMSKRKLFRPIFLQTVLFTILIMPVLAQETPITNNDTIATGSWALQFGISDDFRLSSFRGSLLSVQYHLSPTTAARVGISAQFSYGRTEATFEEPDVSDRQSFTITSAYLFYSKPHREVFLFWGVGPIVDLTRDHYTSHESYSTIGSYTIAKDQLHQRWSIGPNVVVGVEWFAATWLSLHVEYGLSATYSWTKENTIQDRISTDPMFPPQHTEYEWTAKSWLVSPSGVWFGISVYP